MTRTSAENEVQCLSTVYLEEGLGWRKKRHSLPWDKAGTSCSNSPLRQTSDITPCSPGISSPKLKRVIILFSETARGFVASPQKRAFGWPPSPPLPRSRVTPWPTGYRLGFRGSLDWSLLVLSCKSIPCQPEAALENVNEMATSGFKLSEGSLDPLI